MIDEIKYKKFETTVERDVDYTPHYQLTKLADQSYQLYSHADREAKQGTLAETLVSLANLRGGKMLDNTLVKKIAGLEQFESIVVSGSALALKKKASAEEDTNEPWKVVAINGVEYFVKADEDCDEEEHVTKTAALKPVTHTYSVRVVAHNLNELNKIAEANIGAEPCPNLKDNAITVIINSPESMSDLHQAVNEALEKLNIFVPGENIQVFHDECPCGCCCNQQEEVCVPPAVQPEIPQLPQLPQGQLMMVSEEEPKKVSIASSKDTLMVYASAHSKNFKIYDHDHKVVAEVKNGVEVTAEDNTSFAAALDALLETEASKDPDLKVQADEKATFTDQQGRVKGNGEPVQPGDKYVKETDTGVEVKEVKSTMDEEISKLAAELPDFIEKEQDDLNQKLEEHRDPNEKPAEDTKQVGDNARKRWKGMREDPTSHKFVVYITETEEHIFDTIEPAIAFLTRA